MFHIQLGNSQYWDTQINALATDKPTDIKERQLCFFLIGINSNIDFRSYDCVLLWDSLRSLALHTENEENIDF